MHDYDSVCPGCGEDASRTALPDVIHAFRVCECDMDSHAHIVDQLWHVRCYLAAHCGDANEEPEAA